MIPRPNVVLILADDLGYSDLGYYGSEIRTPHLDRVGEQGAKLAQFYNTARCSPSRASLLTGQHPQRTGVGILTNDDRPDGYPGSLNNSCRYGRGDLSPRRLLHCPLRQVAPRRHLRGTEPRVANPARIDHFFGRRQRQLQLLRAGHPDPGEQTVDLVTLPADFYYTDAITAHAVEVIEAQRNKPLFLYVAYTAPHWPLHAQPGSSRPIAGCTTRAGTTSARPDSSASRP